MNQQIVDYIKQNKDQLTRYEIDLYLIKAYFDPKEIDAAWQTFQARPRNKKVSRTFNPLTRVKDLTGLWLFIFSLCLLILAFLYTAVYPIYLVRVTASILRFCFGFLSLVVIWCGLMRERYEAHFSATAKSWFVRVTPYIAAIAGVLFFTLAIFGHGWVDAANLSIDNHTYHLLVEANECGWEDCHIRLDTYKSDNFSLFCSFESEEEYPATYYLHMAWRGELGLSLDPATNKVTITYKE